ncbi:hypothetical protein SAMN05216420_102323 [Nitrosospira sp. Nl5]|uniref:hypothetical protein n=1 Tax=Nitrosospira sp. Nl5 TaxID=200120 RepID=UPI0008850901|nr:hypothetical protein [Nitrosospira sp. Nl5]SCY10797.1 hypothetical protein SAMN05216420_102323 [Nitrosospira sp. Nl5]
MKTVRGRCIYGADGRSDYTLAPLNEHLLFEFGADPDRALEAAVQPGVGLIGPEDLGALPIVDFELMLAHFCIGNFGDVVGHNITCGSCRKIFGVEFSLRTFISALTAEIVKHDSPDFNGAPLALPTRDMIRNANEKSDLVGLVWKNAMPEPGDLSTLEKYLERACPVLEENIRAACPACTTEQSFHFALRDWITAKLKARVKVLLAQIHILASSYHWRFDEILALSRQTRSALIETIRNQGTRSMPGWRE